MSFASALCLDEENPDYHYSIGEVFCKTANYEQSDRHLTKRMELKNESLEAKKLFEKTRKKQGKSNELESGEKPESP